MKNKIYKLLIFVFYSLSLFLLIFCLKVRVTSGMFLYTKVRLLLLFIACLFIYISGYILVKKLNYTKKILKVNLIIYFIIYTVIIITLTLYDEIFGRNGLVIADWNRNLLKTYINTSFNIIPFKTINLFINGYMNGLVTFRDFSINIFGNICVLMPYGILIPLIFKRVDKYYEFLVLMVFFVILIEVFQFITLSGSFDIDDLILNVLGASIIYFVYKIKFINKLINKVFLFG